MTVTVVTSMRLQCDRCGRTQTVTDECQGSTDKLARESGWAFDKKLDTAMCLRCRPRTYVHKTSPKQDRVVRAYGMPFWDVVVMLSEQGMNITQVADRLGYAKRSFQQLMHRHHKRGIFPPCTNQPASRNEQLSPMHPTTGQSGRTVPKSCTTG